MYIYYYANESLIFLQMGDDEMPLSVMDDIIISSSSRERPMFIHDYYQNYWYPMS